MSEFTAIFDKIIADEAKRTAVADERTTTPERNPLPGFGPPTPPLTDAGNAELFVRDHGADLRWVPEWGSWVRFDGKRWRKTHEVELTRLAVDTARTFYRRAAEAPDDELRRKLATHARQMESIGKLTAMISLARGQLVEKAERFDCDHYVLNVNTGTIDLRTGLVRAHRREDYCTRMAPVDFNASATCPTWDAFLARVLPDAATRDWVQRFFGYAVSGDVGEQVLAFLYGKGANGKSTFLETILAILGDVAKAGAPDLLLAKRGESHPTELADLQGARLVVCQETEAGRQWAESLVKRLTGGDRIKARWMKRDFFEFEATHKLVVSANHKPRVRGQDEGIWRRIKLVPFGVTVPAHERDPDLKAKLLNEAPGILMWLLRGCVEWQRDGLGDSPQVVAATKQYRLDQDVLAQFVEDTCVVVAEGFVSNAAIYRAFVFWCQQTGNQEWKRETLLDGLEERGYERGRTMKARGVCGLRLPGA